MEEKHVLRVCAHYPRVGLPETFVAMEVRGDGLGLSWDRRNGVALTHSEDEGSGGNVWTADLPVPLGAAGGVSVFLRFKVVLIVQKEGDDRDEEEEEEEVWQRGPDTLVEVAIGSTPASAVDVFPWFFSERGSLRWIRDLESPELHNHRDVVVYLPPSFEENPLKLHRNIVVLHDAQNLFEDATSFTGVAWHVDATVDTLIHAGEIEEVVLVAVSNNADRFNELAPFYDRSFGAGGLLSLYLDFVEQTVLPAIVESFRGRLILDRTTLGMMGSSLGGLASFFAVWTRSKTWGRCGCISGAFEWGGQALLHNTMASTRPIWPIKIYLDSGDSGDGRDSMAETVEVKEYLEKMGWRPGVNLFYHLEAGAEHNEQAWQQRFRIPCIKLYEPSWIHPRPLLTQQ
jgi:predicted alpha/beta superfamily hydrolase